MEEYFIKFNRRSIQSFDFINKLGDFNILDSPFLIYFNETFLNKFNETNFGRKNTNDLSLEQKLFITPEYLVPLLSFIFVNKKNN